MTEKCCNWNKSDWDRSSVENVGRRCPSALAAVAGGAPRRRPCLQAGALRGRARLDGLRLRCAYRARRAERLGELIARALPAAPTTWRRNIEISAASMTRRDGARAWRSPGSQRIQQWARLDSNQGPTNYEDEFSSTACDTSEQKARSYAGRCSFQRRSSGLRSCDEQLDRGTSQLPVAY